MPRPLTCARSTKKIAAVTQLLSPNQAAERERLLQLVAQLEAGNPLPEPTQHLGQLAGEWRVLYSTITVTVRLPILLPTRPLPCLVSTDETALRSLVCAPMRVSKSGAAQGSRRVKLGLRDLVSLGDFVQRIDDTRRLAVSTPFLP